LPKTVKAWHPDEDTACRPPKTVKPWHPEKIVEEAKTTPPRHPAEDGRRWVSDEYKESRRGRREEEKSESPHPSPLPSEWEREEEKTRLGRPG